MSLLLALLLAHLLAAYLVLVEPLLGARMYESLKRSVPEDRRALGRFYRWTLAVEWSWVAGVGLIVVLGGASLRDIGLVWDMPPPAVLGFIAAAALGSLIPVAVFALRSRRGEGPGVRDSFRQMMEPVSALLPSTREERRLFAAVAVTAGICEEVVFRGFMIFYLSEIFPGMPRAAAVAASSIIFGMAHLYQGLRGVLGTGLFGLAMAILYVMSGSLLVPIILHALLDLRILLLYRPERSETTGL